VKVSRQRPEGQKTERQKTEGQRRDAEVPALPGLVVFEPPRKGRSYVIGADPAEGNPDGDDLGVCSGCGDVGPSGGAERQARDRGFYEYVTEAGGVFQ